MNEYEITMQAIKDLDCIPSKTEWNKIAVQYGFLSSYSLRVISGKNFVSFCKDIRKKF